MTNPEFNVYVYPVLADIDADGDYDLWQFSQYVLNALQVPKVKWLIPADQ